MPCCVSAAELAHAPWREGPKARRQLTLSAVAGHKRLGNSTELGWEGLSQNVGSASRPNGALYQQMYRFIMPPIAPTPPPPTTLTNILPHFTSSCLFRHTLVSSLTPSRLLTHACHTLASFRSQHVYLNVYLNVGTQRGPARTVGLVLNGPSSSSGRLTAVTVSVEPVLGRIEGREAMERGQITGKDQSRDVNVSDFGIDETLFVFGLGSSGHLHPL